MNKFIIVPLIGILAILFVGLVPTVAVPLFTMAILIGLAFLALYIPVRFVKWAWNQ